MMLLLIIRSKLERQFVIFEKLSFMAPRDHQQFFSLVFFPKYFASLIENYRPEHILF